MDTHTTGKVPTTAPRTGALDRSEAAPGSGGARLVLAYMPWATTTRPSLALGILKVLCEEQGVPAETVYANLDMAAEIGFEAAGNFANERCLYGLSEHLFACDIFGPEALASDDYIDTLTAIDLPEMFKDPAYLRRLRDEVVPRFLDRVAARVIALEPTALGVSATFNQVMGGLALANRVKRLRPDIKVLAGGACFDGEMGQEYHRALPQVLDHVFMGEAEVSFREWLRRHRLGLPTAGIPGVTYVEDGALRLEEGGPLLDMNDSPMPDYDDFFTEKQRVLGETGKVFNIEFLPFESSRGCWWGQKNHCVFCGINPELMPFREKDTERVVQEMVTLAARYRVVNLTAADWIISRKSRAQIFRRLKELDFDVECFYETRADLKKDEVELMRDGGIMKVQPGIESFSTELLKLMRKGTSRIRHLQFLRWAKEYGIHLSYNVLAGFPGEQAEWYLEMAEFLPKVRHLQPPLHNVHRVEMHRFSPLFRLREQFGVDELQLRQDYCFNFPDGMVDPLKVGYFFSFSASTILDAETYIGPLRETIEDWIEAHKERVAPVYHYVLGPGFTRITDTRFGEGRYLDLAELHQDVFLLCDEIQSAEKLEAALQPLYPEEVASGRVREIVEELIEQDVLYREGGALLALPIGYSPRNTEALRAYVLGGQEEPAEDGPDGPREAAVAESAA